MSAKIEILKDGVWKKLELKDSSDIRYNARINKIGETSNRQIGSTNTFSLPYTSVNIKALGINRFNQSTLALALNRKYEAKYIVDETIIQTGFLLINNTKNGNINVNFIDKALDVVSKWGEITYQELLLNESLRIASDYQDSIEELRSYSMDNSSVLTPLTNIGSRGYNLCIFPNNLNAIGDDFQQDADDLRQDDSFNPYQSRPIFNAMSLFDLACERYGYQGIFDDSVDWTTIKNTYFISEENDKNEEEVGGGFSIVEYSTSGTYQSYWRENFNDDNNSYGNLMRFPSSVSITPNSISNWVDNIGVYDPSLFNIFFGGRLYKPTSYWRDANTVYTPNLQYGTGGEIRFIASTDLPDTSVTPTLRVVAYWYPQNEGDDIISEYFGDKSGDPPFPSTITRGSEFDVDITVDKSFFNAIPTGASNPIGISIINEEVARFNVNGTQVPLKNMKVVEISNTSSTVTFDDNSQFENNPVDFTYAASRKTLRSLLVGIMHKEGILINIDDDDKTIKFFTYAHYEKQQEDGNYEVWDDYYLKNSEPEWQTNYGNNYARVNNISLSSPFKGNIYPYSLENQGELSRYKASGTDTNKVYKDVENVKSIPNTNNPYTEYTSKGLGLVEIRGVVSGELTQYRVASDTNVSQGLFTGLPLIANVNYSTIPQGVDEWYSLIDKAVRVKAKFLLPIRVIKDLDLSKPIYVGELGGYYIIEEISEYTGPSNEVTVKLIRLISELGEPAPAPSITLNSTVYDPTNVLGGTDYSILNTISFNNYIPTSATIVGTQIENGVIVPGGRVFTETLTFPPGPYSNIDVEFVAQTPLGSDEGQYRIRVEDNSQIDPITGNLLISNVEFKDWVNNTNPAIIVDVENVINSTGVANISYEYYSFVGVNPTSATFKYTLWDVSTNTALDFPVTISWPLTPTQDTVLVDFGASGDYKIEIVTNEATWTSEDLPNGVVSID